MTHPMQVFGMSTSSATDSTLRTVSISSSAPSTSAHTPSAGTQNVNVIYKALYIPATTRKDKTSSTRATGSRVLTSAKGLSLLKANDEKKQKQMEEKEGEARRLKRKGRAGQEESRRKQ